MEQEGEEREDREAQTDLERAGPERVLEVDRGEGGAGPRGPDPGDAREGDRHPVQGHRPPLPPRGRGVRDEGHRARAHEGPAEPVAPPGRRERAGGRGGAAERGAAGRDPARGPTGAPPSPWLARTRASWSGLAATAYRRRLTASQSSPRFSGSFRPTRSARRPIRRFAGAWTAEKIPTITPTWRRSRFRERAYN